MTIKKVKNILIISIQQIYGLIKNYKIEGKRGFIHKT